MSHNRNTSPSRLWAFAHIRSSGSFKQPVRMTGRPQFLYRSCSVALAKTIISLVRNSELTPFMRSRSMPRRRRKAKSHPDDRTAQPNRQPGIVAGKASLPTESRASIAATVFWMIALLATILAEVSLFLVWSLRTWLGPDATQVAIALCFTLAAATGLCALIGMTIAWIVRDIPAPLIIAWTTLLVALPPVVLFLIWL